MRQILRAMVLMVLLGLLAACAQATSVPATLTPQVITVVVTGTPVPTQIATPTATRGPTLMPYPTDTPYPTPTPFVLRNSNPSDLDVVRFIFNHRDRLYFGETILSELARGTFNNFTRQDYDLNGDKIPEIIITGSIWDYYVPFIAVVSFSPDASQPGQGKWSELFYKEFSGHYCGDIRATFKGNRLILDALTCTGGTGDWQQTWEQGWIKCGPTKCATVFSFIPQYLEEYGSSTSNGEYSITNVEEPSDVTLKVKTQHFGIKELPDYIFPAPTRLLSGSTEESVFIWDGNQYSWQSKRQILPAIEISREFDWRTRDIDYWVDNMVGVPSGGSDDPLWDKFYSDWDTFWGITPKDRTGLWSTRSRSVDVASQNPLVDPNYVAGIVGDPNKPICRLTVQRLNGNAFELAGRDDEPCLTDFSKLSWVDIDSDGIDELLFMTLAPDLINMRRLYVYRIEPTLQKIATVEGFINGSDGIGIKWEKTGHDFTLFIGLSFSGTSKDHKCMKLSCVTNDRRFQTYRWDKATNSFKPEGSPQT